MNGSAGEVVRYVAAGGVVVGAGRVLVLERPGRNEIRLPKGHVEHGESAEEAAVREVREESGLFGVVVADLGEQVVEFEYRGRRVIRTEHYFLMSPGAEGSGSGEGEPQFDPRWVAVEEALECLTFEAEREWVRRAVGYGDDDV